MPEWEWPVSARPKSTRERFVQIPFVSTTHGAGLVGSSQIMWDADVFLID